MTFLPVLPSDDESSERVLNPMPYPLYLHLSGSILLVNSTDPNKQFPNVKSVFKSLGQDLPCKKYIN